MHGRSDERISRLEAPTRIGQKTAVYKSKRSIVADVSLGAEISRKRPLYTEPKIMQV